MKVSCGDITFRTVGACVKVTAVVEGHLVKEISKPYPTASQLFTVATRVKRNSSWREAELAKSCKKISNHLRGISNEG